MSDLHKGKGAPTVKYSKIMPDFDLLMQVSFIMKVMMVLTKF